MRTLKFTLDIKQSIIILTVLFLFVVTACSKRMTFLTSSVIPAARGEVAIKNDTNNNYNIEIKISYLAEPERLDPPKKVYVVWMTSEDNSPINLGQIVVTSKLNVKFETVSSSKPKQIFITAEDDPRVQSPGAMMVLETNNF